LPDATVTARRTVAETVALGASVLTSAGVDTPRLDAELLLAFVLGVGRERLVLEAPAEVDDAGFERFVSLVARRAAREPVAYIVGRKEFRRVALYVDRRVLIPRPETELLVEIGISLPSGSRVVDVGTGSGAVALALKSERPDLSVLGTDVSPDALAVARENARRLELEVEFVQADLLDGVPGPFDAVLANLPYVAEQFELPPDVLLHEPASALRAGADGLDVIRRLVEMASGIPVVALEVGFDQAPAVCALLRNAGSLPVRWSRDSPVWWSRDAGSSSVRWSRGAGSLPVRWSRDAPVWWSRDAGSLPVRWSRDAPVWWSRDAGSLSVRSSQANRPGFRSIEVLLDLAGHDRVVVARR
jgi:release factor glutamine methyltransferase